MMLSVIIPTLNEEENIGECLDSIFSQSLTPSEVLIVDKYSTDKTVEIAKSYSDSAIKLKIFRYGGNVGEARDIAVKHAKGEIIFSTDADAQIERRGHFARIVKDFSTQKDLVCWSGSIHDPDFALQTYVVGEALRGKMGICGANFAFKKAAYNMTGGFPSLDVAEDMILYIRMMAKYPGRHVYREEYGVEMRFNIFEWLVNIDKYLGKYLVY